MPNTTTTNTVSLCGWHDEITSSVKALLFGELVKLVSPVVKHYHSDLFHDALVINDLEGPAVLIYAARECGTHLSRPLDTQKDEEEIFALFDGHNSHIWRVELCSDGGYWKADITPLKGGGAEG